MKVPTTLREQAKFETTRRLLAAVVNEGLVDARVDEHLRLWIACGSISVSLAADVAVDGIRLCRLLDPEDLEMPVVVEGEERMSELNPGVLFRIMYPYLDIDSDLKSESVRNQVVTELVNSATNQEQWFRRAQELPMPHIMSPGIEWERSMISGHPTHPMHRTCLSQRPLAPISPYELPSILNPTISFLAVLRTDVRIAGDFEEKISFLLKALGVADTTPPHDRIIVPCLNRQIPAIHARFPNTVQVYTYLPLMQASAQSSLRTVTLPPYLGFPYHLKLPLACKVTSAVRTITPWTTCVGPELSRLLGELLPDSFWVCGEVATVAGSLEDFSEARHLSCVIRDDLEIRARAQGEVLIVASALAERDVHTRATNLERILGLDSVPKKKAWLKMYSGLLFRMTIPTLLRYGICLEGHGQNILLRIDPTTSETKGLAVRDLGGVRIHTPTLHAQGYKLETALPGSSILTEDLSEVWSKTHHTLIQNHINQFVRGLKLHHEGGWGIVRTELRTVLRAQGDNDGIMREKARELETFFFKEMVPFKCFMRMQMAGVYRHYLYKEMPNIILT